MPKQQQNPIFLLCVLSCVVFNYSKHLAILTELITVGFECGKTVVHKRCAIAITEFQNDGRFALVVDFTYAFELQPGIALGKFLFY